MNWIITDAQSRPTTISRILADYPDAVAYDESGWQVNMGDLSDDSETLADAGYFGREYRRILIWENETASQDDAGERAIASAVWADESK